MLVSSASPAIAGILLLIWVPVTNKALGGKVGGGALMDFTLLFRDSVHSGHEARRNSKGRDNKSKSHHFGFFCFVWWFSATSFMRTTWYDTRKTSWRGNLLVGFPFACLGFVQITLAS